MTAPSSSTASAPRTPYRVRAMSVEACSCAHGCNCQFGGTPNEGFCEFIIAWEIKEGTFGAVDLSGFRAAIAAKYPGAIHEGHGHVVLFVDDDSRSDQVAAFATILSGQMGGMPWEALAGTIERLEGPVAAPIELTIDGQLARVRIAGQVELETTPLLNPVTGDPKEVHISYPKGGFFWNDGNIVTTRTMRVDRETVRMAWPSKYAATAEVNWTNAS
jgi:hypothetical protein